MINEETHIPTLSSLPKVKAIIPFFDLIICNTLLHHIWINKGGKKTLNLFLILIFIYFWKYFYFYSTEEDEFTGCTEQELFMPNLLLIKFILKRDSWQMGKQNCGLRGCFF